MDAQPTTHGTGRSSLAALGVASVPPGRGPFAIRASRFAFGLATKVMATVQLTRAEQFAVLRGVPGAIVFLGDSITEGGLWSEWFPDQLVSNRGTGGETTAQVLARLDSAIDDPRAVFLLAGTNDLAQGETPAAIAGRLAQIVDGISSRSPGCPVYLQSVMPRKPHFAEEILDLNARIRVVCGERPDVSYVELWPALTTPDAGLRPELTNDALHLNGLGYAAWVDVIRPLVDRLPASPGT